VEVHLADGGEVAVRVVDHVRDAVGVADLDPVVRDLGPRDDAHPDAVSLVVQLRA